MLGNNYGFALEGREITRYTSLMRPSLLSSKKLIAAILKAIVKKLGLASTGSKEETLQMIKESWKKRSRGGGFLRLQAHETRIST